MGDNWYLWIIGGIIVYLTLILLIDVPQARRRRAAELEKQQTLASTNCPNCHSIGFRELIVAAGETWTEISREGQDIPGTDKTTYWKTKTTYQMCVTVTKCNSCGYEINRSSPYKKALDSETRNERDNTGHW